MDEIAKAIFEYLKKFGEIQREYGDNYLICGLRIDGAVVVLFEVDSKLLTIDSVQKATYITLNDPKMFEKIDVAVKYAVRNFNVNDPKLYP